MASKSNKPITINPAKTGPLTYKQLQMLNASGAGSTWNFGNNVAPASSYMQTSRVADPIYSASKGKDFLGNSKWDDTDNMGFMEWQEAYEDPFALRALNQPVAVKWLNDMLGSSELAVSTFLNSIVGLVVGLGTGGYRALGEGKGWDGFTSGFWDNAVINALSDLDEITAEATKNYYTKEEEERPWYEKLFSEQMWGNGLLRSAGFTVGALAAAYVTKGLGIGSAIGKGLLLFGAGQKAVTAAATVSNYVVNSVLSAAGEASIEAHQAVHDAHLKIDNDLTNYVQYARNKYELEYMMDLQRGVDPDIAETNYNAKLEKLQTNIKKILKNSLNNDLDIGNSVFGSNLAILSISNAIEFPRVMKGGWGTHKLFEKTAFKKGKSEIAREVAGKKIGISKLDDELFGRGLATGESKLVNTAKHGSWKDYIRSGIINTITEGSEEGSQRLISDSNLMLAYAKLLKTALEKGWIDRALDPTITNEMANYTKALGNAWNQSFGDASKSGWEEVFLGAMTGVLGVPMVGRKSNGKVGLTWQGGFREGFKEKEEHFNKVLKQVDFLNNILDNDKLKSHARHAAVGLSLSRDKRLAFFNDDHVTFKNLQMAEAISDAILIKDLLDSGDAYTAFLDELLKEGVTDLFIEEYKAVNALDLGISKEDFDNDISNEELNERIMHDVSTYLRYTKQAMQDWDDLKADKRTKDLGPEAFNELLTSYSLSKNMKERIQLLQDENRALDPNDTVQNEKLKKNNKDILRLLEDSKILEERVQQALEDPDSFNTLVNLKINNALKRGALKANEEVVESMKSAETIQQLANTYFGADKSIRDDLLDKAYEEGDESVKQRITNFRNFLQDSNVVFDALNEAWAKLGVTKTQHAIKGLLSLHDRYELWKNLKVDELKTGNPLVDNALEMYKTGTISLELLNSQEYEDEDLALQMTQILPLLEEIENNAPLSFNEAISNVSDEIRTGRQALGNLIESVYNDLILKDNDGVTGLTVATELKKLLQTLYNDGSLTPELLKALSKSLEALNSIEAIRKTAERIKEERKKRQEENKDKDKNKNNDKEDKEDKEKKEDEEKYGLISLNEKAEELGIKIGDRLKRLDLKIYADENTVEYNDEHFPDRDLQKLIRKVHRNLGSVNALELTNVIKTIKQGYGFNITMLDSLIKNLDKKLEDLTDDEYTKLAEDVENVSIKNDIEELLSNNNEESNEDTNDLEEDEDFPNEDDEDIDDGGNGNLVNDVYEDRPDVEKDSTDPKNPVFDAFGNKVREYDYRRSREGVLEKNEDFSPTAKTMTQTDNVHPLYAIDNLLKHINPDTPVYHITTGGDIVYLAIRYDSTIEDIINKKKVNKPELSIVDTNDGKFIIVGNLDWDNVGSERNNYYNRVKSKLLEGKKSVTNLFYVDTSFSTKLKKIIPGDIITETEGNPAAGAPTNVVDLLDNPNTNPANITIDDLAFGIVMGNLKTGLRFETVRTRTGRKYTQPKTLSRPGEVYMYIPASNGLWIPIKLSSLSSMDFNTLLADGFKDTDWYKEIIKMVSRIVDPNFTGDKLKLYLELKRNFLIFNKTHPNTLVKLKIDYFNKDSKLKYLDADGKWNNINSIDEFEKLLEEFNPRLNIRKSFLKDNLEFMLRSGILLTDCKILSTVNGTPVVYGLDEDFNIINSDEILSEDSSASNESPERIEQYVNKNRYIYQNGVWYVNGQGIIGTLPKELEDALLIRNGQCITFNYTVGRGDNKRNVTHYILPSGAVYVDEINTNGYKTGYNKLNKSEAKPVLKAYTEFAKTLKELEEKKKSIEEKEKEGKKEKPQQNDNQFTDTELQIIEIIQDNINNTDDLRTALTTFFEEHLDEVDGRFYDSDVGMISTTAINELIGEYLRFMNPDISIVVDYEESAPSNPNLTPYQEMHVEKDGIDYGSPINVLTGFFKNLERYVQLLGFATPSLDNSKNFATFASQINKVADEVGLKVVQDLTDFLDEYEDPTDNIDSDTINNVIELAKFIGLVNDNISIEDLINNIVDKISDMRVDDIAKLITDRFENLYNNNLIDVATLSNTTAENLLQTINRINNC